MVGDNQRFNRRVVLGAQNEELLSNVTADNKTNRANKLAARKAAKKLRSSTPTPQELVIEKHQVAGSGLTVSTLATDKINGEVTRSLIDLKKDLPAILGELVEDKIQSINGKKDVKFGYGRLLQLQKQFQTSAKDSNELRQIELINKVEDQLEYFFSTQRNKTKNVQVDYTHYQTAKSNDKGTEDAKAKYLNNVKDLYQWINSWFQNFVINIMKQESNNPQIKVLLDFVEDTTTELVAKHAEELPIYETNLTEQALVDYIFKHTLPILLGQYGLVTTVDNEGKSIYSINIAQTQETISKSGIDISLNRQIPASAIVSPYTLFNSHGNLMVDLIQFKYETAASFKQGSLLLDELIEHMKSIKQLDFISCPAISQYWFLANSTRLATGALGRLKTNSDTKTASKVFNTNLEKKSIDIESSNIANTALIESLARLEHGSGDIYKQQNEIYYNGIDTLLTEQSSLRNFLDMFFPKGIEIPLSEFENNFTTTKTDDAEIEEELITYLDRKSREFIKQYIQNIDLQLILSVFPRVEASIRSMQTISNNPIQDLMDNIAGIVIPNTVNNAYKSNADQVGKNYPLPGVTQKVLITRLLTENLIPNGKRISEAVDWEALSKIDFMQISSSADFDYRWKQYQATKTDPTGLWQLRAAWYQYMNDNLNNFQKVDKFVRNQTLKKAADQILDKEFVANSQKQWVFDQIKAKAHIEIKNQYGSNLDLLKWQDFYKESGLFSPMTC